MCAMNDNDGPEVVIAEKSSDDLKCPHCEHVLAGGEVFCPNCLQRLKDVGEEVQEERLTYEDAIVRAHPRIPQALKWVAVVFLLALALLMVWYGWIRPTAEHYLAEGDKLYNRGLYEESLDFYQQALEQDPELARAHLQEGLVYYRLARDEDAIGAFQRALMLDPGLGEAYLGLGKTYYYLHNFGASRENLIKAQQLMPGRRDVYAFLGGTYLEENRTADAVQFLEKAVELNPDDAKAFFDLGRAKSALADYAGAAKAFERAIQLVPDNLEAQQYLAQTYQQLDRSNDALTIWKELVQTAPDDLWMRSALAKNLYELGEYQEAEAELNEVVEMAKRAVPLRDAYLYLGWSNYQQGEYEKAIQEFQAAYTLDPGQADAFGGIGLALTRLGKCPEAISPLEFALSQQSDWAEVRQALAACKAQQ